MTQNVAIHDEVATHRIIATRAGIDARWDRYVAAHPAGSTHLQSGWLRALSREVRTPQIHLACEADGGRLLGVLPLVATRGMPFGGRLADRRWSSLPRTPIGGPLASTQEVAAALVSHAARIAEDDGASLQLKRCSTDLDGLVPGVVRLPWRKSLVLELPDDPEDLAFGSSRQRRKIQAAVRKADRVGVRVRVADLEDLDAWYWLYLATMRWHCVPARSRRFFATILAPWGPAELLVVENGTPDAPRMLGGAVMVRSGATMSYAFNGVDRSALILRPNDALQWHAIRRACRLGYRWYDFGEVSSGNEGLHQFKRKWGSEEVALHHYYFPGIVDRGDVDDEPMNGRIGRLARRTWQQVPLPVTEVVGGLVNARL